MKNFGKKTLVLVLVLVLAISVVALVACSKKNTPADESTTKDNIPNLEIVFEQDDNLKNTYTMIGVKGSALATPVVLNEVGADSFIKWMSLAATRTNYIQTYGVENYKEALFYLLDSAPLYNGTAADLAYTTTKSASNEIKISTTTSVNDTGLLQYLAGKFQEETGWKLLITSAGTGKAIQNAKDGNADMLLVHAKAQEEAFVDLGYARVVDGFTSERISFMYNYFVLVGPKTDPAGVKSKASIVEGFQAIKNTQSKFVSRGDNSGTHTKEIALWKLAGENDIGWDTATSTAVYPQTYTWYTAAAAGMTASLAVANETNAYILSDKGTYLANKNAPKE